MLHTHPVYLQDTIDKGMCGVIGMLGIPDMIAQRCCIQVLPQSAAGCH